MSSKKKTVQFSKCQVKLFDQIFKMLQLLYTAEKACEILLRE